MIAAAIRKLRRVETAAPPDSRQALRAAKAQVVRATRSVETAKLGTARAREIIARADRAAREADEAEKAYGDSVTEWAARGMVGEVAGAPALLAKSNAARAHAVNARLVADGVAASLTQALWDPGRERMVNRDNHSTTEEREARDALEQAQANVKDAIGQIMREEAEPLLRRALALHDELAQLLPALSGARHYTRFSGVHFGSNPQEFIERYNRLAEFRVPTYDREQERLNTITGPWLDFAQRLLNDSDAQFS